MPKLGDNMDCNGYRLKDIGDPIDDTDAINKSYADSRGSYTHTEAVASSSWDISHSLGYFPNVTVIDSSEREVIGDIQYVDSNNIVITFSAAFTGKAYLS